MTGNDHRKTGGYSQKVKEEKKKKKVSLGSLRRVAKGEAVAALAGHAALVLGAHL